jgi:uncharacterized protein YoaH (UPF0181 family)
MASLLKVFALFNELTYEQQAEIVDHWMSGRADAAPDLKKVPPAGKVAVRRRRDPYTPAEVERIQKMILDGKPGTAIAQSMWELAKDHRTVKAWENRISLIKLEMRRTGEIK